MKINEAVQLAKGNFDNLINSSNFLSPFRLIKFVMTLLYCVNRVNVLVDRAIHNKRVIWEIASLLHDFSLTC